MEQAVLARIAAAAQSAVVDAAPLGGGCVGDVYRVTLADGRAIVAKVGDPQSGVDIEGAMLSDLRRRSRLPLPDVLFREPGLLLETLLPSGGALGAAAQRHAADLIADLHGVTSAQGFGYFYDTVIGGLPQPNPWTPRWIDFFRSHRLVHMADEAHRADRLPQEIWLRVRRLADHLERWLDAPEAPALIHGDLWTGNILVHQNRISGFIDPAISFSDREIELAFTTLFATFGHDFFNRYNEIRPIRPGFFECRRDIYNLYPLLVHVRLFGGSYVRSVDTTLRRFGH
ncbi:fructosamine kinase family protein [Varunaivibrio sulfuroxidans]|uniref:Fructosamine-3-kinase n=1 Tax=Varunaivibrio sulfuroxidans TaxID=1773489 RepID=A0A4R3JH22_9PROT|nr:fructosamine kinase family protein [Varunaivibrio sulfuroxidans]TCS64795.1 fructosamine-3-kinase [Varunaivibrio sulfuroxidans]WES29901.1 fructosamine kinase family protein [Varunaivibrio sulfuroxidans]